MCRSDRAYSPPGHGPSPLAPPSLIPAPARRGAYISVSIMVMMRSGRGRAPRRAAVSSSGCTSNPVVATYRMGRVEILQCRYATESQHYPPSLSERKLGIFGQIAGQRRMGRRRRRRPRSSRVGRDCPVSVSRRVRLHPVSNDGVNSAVALHLG